MEQHRTDVRMYEVAKSSWHEKQDIMTMAENKQIEKHEKKMWDRSSSETAEKAKNQAARATQSREVGEKNYKYKLAKQDYDNFLSSNQQQEYIEKGLQYDIARKLSVKTATDDLTSGLDAQVSDHRAEAVKQKIEDYAYSERQQEYIEKGLQFDIAKKLNMKTASNELTSGLDAQISDHKAKAVKQKMEDYAYREKQHEYIEKALQDDIAKKLDEKAASDELTIGLDAQISDHKAEAMKQKMEDYAYRIKMMEDIEEARLQKEEEENMVKAKNKIYAADLLQQIEDNKKRREKERRLYMPEKKAARETRSMEFGEKNFNAEQHEYIEKGLQYDMAEKLNVRAASDELTSGLDAQVSDHKAKAVKQKMEDNAFRDKQHEYTAKYLQHDIAEELNVKAASDELTSGLNAQVCDNKAKAVKQKKEDFAFSEKMMEGIEVARLQEEEEKNMVKAKNKIYAADLLQQIEDNKKRREEERRLYM